ncbi:aminomethyl transferase family protein [Alkalibaculum sp. M08DMB]|uniref:Aminomethyl transferase family protein n=1 Tax=Alkalibaculum sporogenes TaxID=2655001 RepID=A0A6A7KDT1_9FIRM|nr:aminomethyltransferase family protein [Alkalibaculum sporogenes]MPW27307.1 aminomethyl transferase family protein [Alkalibaculum sporogenes]
MSILQAGNSKILENANLTMPLGPFTSPFDYTGPKDEFLATRKTASIGCALSISPVYDVYGPDAVKLLNYVSVNRDYGKMKINSLRHTIMCNEEGLMIGHGALIKLDENHFRTYWLAPLLNYYVENLGMDVQGHMIQDEYFFQIDGPKSLEILEKACQCDLHGMKFAQRQIVNIAGSEMSIMRLGMSGNLAYEVHGPVEKGEEVYDLILEAGKEFGIKQQGYRTYRMNHTPGGYPNQYLHFCFPLMTEGDPRSKYYQEAFLNPWGITTESLLKGSCSDNHEHYYATPYDVNWGDLVNFEYDFIGKEALQKIANNPPKTVVTLEWDPDDIGKVFASQFRGTEVEPFDAIEKPLDGFEWNERPTVVYAWKVLLDGKFIGVASAKTNDYYSKRMISLAIIDKEFAVEGNEVAVLWGSPGSPQVEIKAKIAKFPYFNEEFRNEKFDTSNIPVPDFLNR